jgi:hypothetical protein
MSEGYKKGGSVGCGAMLWIVGMMIAVVLSWEAHHSVVWATVHGLFGWFYVVYIRLLH